MADPRLPTLTQNWQLDINNPAAENAGETNNNRKTLFAIKDSLVSFQESPWTVNSSSDSVNVTGDTIFGVVPEESNNTSASLSFDGTDWLIVGDKSALKFDVGDAFSISAWFKTSFGGASQSIVSKRSSDSSNRGYVLNMSTGGQMFFQIIDDLGASQRAGIDSSISSLNDGIWHHVLVTKDTTENQSGLTMYVDGIDVTSPFDDTFVSNGGNTFDTQAGFQISGFRGANQEMVGEIAQVAVYDKELSSLEAATVYEAGTTKDLSSTGPFANLVGYWRMGFGATFPIIPDDSTNSNDGEMVEMVAGDINLLGDGTPTNMESGDFRDVILASEQMLDESTNSNHGTITNMEDTDFNSDTPGGVSSYSSLFDGVNEYITMGDPAELKLAHNGTFSFSFWAKASDAVGIILSKQESAGNFRGYIFSWWDASGSVQFRLTNTTTTNSMFVRTSSSGWDDGQWHHFVATWDGTISQDVSNATIYIDGMSQSLVTVSNTLSATIDTTTHFNLGARNNGNLPFDGQLDEVAVYDKELTSAEVLAIYNSGAPNDLKLLSTASNLIGWWRMGDLMQACVAPFSTIATVFDGVNERVVIGDVSAFSFENNRPFSISAWFKTSATSGMLWAKRLNSGTFRGYSLHIDSSGDLRFQILNTNSTNHLRVDTPGGFNDGAWHHVVVTKDSSTAASGVHIYIDDVDLSLTPVVDNLTATVLNSEEFTIGSGSGSAFLPFDGSIDDVAVYNKELTSGEVTTIYNNGCPPDLNAIGPFANLVGYWFMGEGVVTVAGADLWIDENDLVWSTGNHSWIVLNKPSTGSQLLLSLDRAVSRDLIIYWSPRGNFTGGTISVDPTASDQVALQTAAPWNGNLSTFSSWVHVWHTEDGKRTRIVVTTDQANPTAFWILDEVDPIPDNWAPNPEVVYIYEGTEAMSFEAGSLAAVPVTGNAAKSWDGTAVAGSRFDIGLFSLGFDSVPSGFGGFNAIARQEMGSIGNQLNDDEPFPMAPAGVVSFDTGFRGVHGILADMYIGHKDRNGSTYPDSTTEKLWAQFNDVILPWTGGSAIPIETPSPGGAIGVVADESVNSNDGTPTNMEVADFELDSPGGSFSTTSTLFGGSNEYILIGDVAALQFERTDPFSISCWFKTTTTLVLIMVSKLDSSSPFPGYELVFDGSDGAIALQIINTNTTNDMHIDTTVGGWNDGAWHHCVATWDGDASPGAAGANIYIDGILQEKTILTDNLTGSILTASPFQIAARDGTTLPFIGNIDDVAVYDKELDQYEVATIYDSANPKTGFSENSITFDGVNEYITMGNISTLDFDNTDAFSISCWAKYSATSGFLISKQHDALTAPINEYRGYSFDVISSGLRFIHRNQNTGSNLINVAITTGPFNDELWHHFIVTYDGSQTAAGCHIYVDGSDRTLTVITDNLSATTLNTADFNIGARNNIEVPFDGKIDDVAIYNKELSPAEVTTIYNNGLPANLTSIGPTANLVGYWLMGDGDTFPTIIDNSVNTNNGTMTNMEVSDITGDVPGLTVGTNGVPSDLRVVGPTANLVGYWLMGEGVVSTPSTTETTNNGVLVGYGATAATGATQTFVMTGIDTGAPSQPTYHFWTVTDEPDPTGAFAIGPDAPPFGGPLIDIYVSAQYEVVE